METATPHLNADPAELAKFSALAARWWDPQSEFRPLHEINPLRLNWIQEHVPLAGKTVLDVGCGGGILSESMARAGGIVRGIDLADKSLKIAQLHSLESGIPVAYECIAVEQLAVREPGHYDVVTCMEMLEHVPQPAEIVRACAQLVKPGGHVFFSTLSRNAKAFLYAILGAEYVLQLLPKGTHEYAKFLKPSELARYCRYAGLEPAQLAGMTYQPLTRQYRLTADTSVNYLMACTRPL